MLRTCCALATQSATRENFLEVASGGSRPSVPLYVSAPGRVVAIGDIHGDLSKAITCLELAGVLQQIDQVPAWCGGNTTIVQLGDILDRGDQEIGTLLLLEGLRQQAVAQGGNIYMLNGNHESLNVIGNFVFATRGGMQEAAKAAGLTGPALRQQLSLARGRRMMYRPGGPIASMLARNPTVLIVNQTLFVHGGLLPAHIDFGLQRINDAVSAFMLGNAASDNNDNGQRLAMGNAHSIVWNREFGAEVFKEDGRKQVMQVLNTVLERVGATEMVIGHTPQQMGANSEMDGKLWRLDVGMSCGVLNAAPQVLEITQDLHGRSVKRILTAIPVSSGIPTGVPYCQIRW